MEADPRVVLLGEDILDPYGGAFKATRGCSTRLSEQVLTTTDFRSLSGGHGERHGAARDAPVVEIMFGIFFPWRRMR